MTQKQILFFCLFILISCKIFSQNTVVPPPPGETDSTGKKIFERVEIEASYPGGIAAWRKFLERTLNPDVPLKNGAPAGYYTILVRFIVSKTGEVTEVKPLTNYGYGMEEEVIRTMNKAGNWNPGEQNKRLVNSYHTQPITFVVQNEGLEISTNKPHKLFAVIENKISIAAYKVKAGDIGASVNNGKITSAGDGNFIVTVNDTTRRAVITVYNIKKDNKEIGAESFEVRPLREAPAVLKQKE